MITYKEDELKIYLFNNKFLLFFYYNDKYF